MALKTYTAAELDQAVLPSSGNRDNNLRDYWDTNGSWTYPLDTGTLDDSLFAAAGEACGIRATAVEAALTANGT